MSKVTRSGERVRPSWNYLSLVHTHAPRESEDSVYAVLEMTESVRNAIEELGRSQMLQYDVAHAIKATLKEIRGLRRDLQKRRRKP